MKPSKILLSITGVALLLAVAAIAVFVTTFDANQYKQDMSGLVQTETGRKLDFKGDVSLSLYPTLGMQLGSISLHNAPGFDSQPMLQVKHASVSVDVVSLLSFKPKIDRLVLEGLSLHLQKNRQGKTNWDDLIQSSPTTQSQSASTANSATTTSGASKIALAASFGGLDIRHVEVTWKDDRLAQNYHLNIEKLTTGRIAQGLKFPLYLKLSVASGEQLSTNLTLQAMAKVLPQQVSLSAVKLETTASGRQIPVDQVQLKLLTRLTYALSSRRLDIDGLNATVQTNGGIVESSRTTLGIDKIGFDLARQRLKTRAIDIRAELQGDTVPNQRLITRVQSSQLDVALKKHAIDIQGLLLALGENQFKGYVQVADYTRPDVTFALKSALLDVDKLLGKTSTPAAPAPSPAAARDVEIPLPMELLRKLRLDGKIEIAELKAQGLKLNDVKLSLRADKGIVALRPIDINLYDGSLAGGVEINVQKDKPRYRVQQRLSAFHIGEFLLAFMQKDMLSGKANVDLKLSTSGNRLSQLKAGLNGVLQMKVLDGSVKGLNLRQKITIARARLKHQKAPQFVPKATDFSSLSLSAKIIDGVLNSNDLDLQAPLMRVGGQGSVNLVDETLDYLVKAKLVATTEGQQGATADQLRGIPIPVLIKGPWSDPKFDVQLGKVLQAKLAAQKAKIRAQIDQKKAQLQKQLTAEKAKLKAAQQKELAAKKLQLQQKQALAAAREKARIKAAEAKKSAELAARKKQLEEAAKKKLKDKLKKLF